MPPRQHTTTQPLLRLAAALALAASAHAQVELWNGDPLDATVVSADPLALTVRTPGAQTDTLIAWDLVRTVTTDPPLDPDLLERATSAWRARTRLERDDWRAAEPLFESLFTTLDTADGPTAATIAEGLLRCRLRRGAQASAVFPWLTLQRLRSERQQRTTDQPSWIGGTLDLPDIIDPATGLAPGLPPIWIADPALAAVISAPDWELIPRNDETARDLATLYRAAARFEQDGSATAPAPTTRDPSVDFAHDVVRARIGTPDERAEARTNLQARLDTDGIAPWIEVWCRAGIGRSLLLENDPTLVRQGVVQLLHIPARFGTSHPYLAGLALAESAQALEQLADTETAAILRAELNTRYPKHPVHRTLARPGAPSSAHRPNADNTNADDTNDRTRNA